MARGRRPIGKQAMTPAQRQRRRRALKQTSETRKYSEDPRRSKPLSITWETDLVGLVRIDGEYWAAVEWSNKHQCWCIEDSEGACLRHQEAIHGAAPSKDAAVALATEMIRDGRMPTPQEAKQARWARLPEEQRARKLAFEDDRERRRQQREKRAQQPAQQRKRAERQRQREQSLEAWRRHIELMWREDEATPLYEVLSELWKSNSFASLRPRLITHVEAAVAKLGSEHIDYTQRMARAQLVQTEQRLAKASRDPRSIAAVLANERTSGRHNPSVSD
jgi:hypothetical protein